MNKTDDQFLAYLLETRNEFIRELEDLLGKRDPDYEILDVIRVAEDSIPCIYFPEGLKIKKIEIRLGSDVIEKRDYEWATWQLAHECVHLLDPGEIPTIVMEEGIACWFQDKKVPRNYVPTRAYTCARVLVEPLVNHPAQRAGH